MIAIFAEGVVISRASLKSLMKRREEGSTFCPKSVFHFAWPILDFVTVDRWAFVHRVHTASFVRQIANPR